MHLSFFSLEKLALLDLIKTHELIRSFWNGFFGFFCLGFSEFISIFSFQCEALFHFGFYRGGYQCNCKPGFRLPYYQNGPFQGVDIERATEDEYLSGFDCIPIMWKQITPTVDGAKDIDSRKKRSVLDGEYLLFGRYFVIIIIIL